MKLKDKQTTHYFCPVCRKFKWKKLLGNFYECGKCGLIRKSQIKK